MDLSSFVLIVDEHIKRALREDITSEDVSTAAVMPEAHRGTVELIAKQDGVIAGLQVFESAPLRSLIRRHGSMLQFRTGSASHRGSC